MLDKAKARAARRNKSLPRLSDELPLLDVNQAFVAIAEKTKELTRDLPERFSHLKPHLKKGREKLEDAYVAVLQTVLKQKERLEDYIAEKKDRLRTRRVSPQIHDKARTE